MNCFDRLLTAVFTKINMICFRIPRGGLDVLPILSCHVETVVLLSHKSSDSVINVKVEFGEVEGKVLLDNISYRAERAGYL